MASSLSLDEEVREGWDERDAVAAENIFPFQVA
jgi:hypothetical protein